MKECVGFEVVNWHLFDRNLIKAVSNICDENGVKRLGFERSNITFDRYEALKNMKSFTILEQVMVLEWIFMKNHF